MSSTIFKKVHNLLFSQTKKRCQMNTQPTPRGVTDYYKLQQSDVPISSVVSTGAVLSLNPVSMLTLLIS